MIFDEIWWKRRKKDKLLREYHRAIFRYDKAGDEDQSMITREESDHVIGDMEDELRFLGNRNLIRRAERLGVPVPPYAQEDAWEEAIIDKQRVYLTVQAEANIRRNIREHWSFWVKDVVSPIATILFSIGSLAISIISIEIALHNRTVNQQHPAPQQAQTPAPAPTPSPRTVPKGQPQQK